MAFNGISAAQGGVEFSENTEFEIDKKNVTVMLGQDLFFNSAVVRGDALELNQENLSMSTNTSNSLSAYLWRHDFENPSDGETVFKISASPEQSVEIDFTLTNLPKPNGKYVLKRQGDSLESFTGNTVSWSWADLDEPQNFSLVFDKEEKSSTSSSGSSSSSSGISLSSGGSSVDGDHCWSDTDETSFNASNLGDISNLTLTASTNSTKFCATIDKIDQPEEVEPLDNAYIYYTLELDGIDKTKISEYSLIIDVDQSFVDEYESVKFSSYVEDWKELESGTLIETNSSSRYRVKTDKLNYLAVYGENPPAPVCGDSLCNGDEDWKSCSNDCEKPEEVVEVEKTLQNASETVSSDHPNYDILQEARAAFEQEDYNRAKQLAQEATVQEKNYLSKKHIAVAALVFVFVIAIIAGYIYWRRKLESNIEKLSEQVLAELELHEVSHRKQAYKEIIQAQEALENDDYREVRRRLENIEKITGGN